MEQSETFYKLGPEAVLSAAEKAGFRPTGQFLQLNSLENRVYSLGLEEGEQLVLKFYRPGRWSPAQILEEHAFTFELAEAGLPVCAPEILPSGQSLGQEEGIYFAAWKKSPGRIPDEFTPRMLFEAGRSIALLHDIGSKKQSGSRLRLDSATFIRGPLQGLLDSGAIPRQFSERYQRAALTAATALDTALEGAPCHRIHGDCHWGNLLYDGKGLRFLDFDDFLYGHPAQDIWMIAPAVDQEGAEQREVLLSGYRSLRPFEPAWLAALPSLKAARYVHYAAWISKRWEDPSFKNAFPAFGAEEYWDRETQDLEGLLFESLPRAALPPEISQEYEDVSKLSNKDYFFDMD